MADSKGKHFLDLYFQYPMTNLSFSDLYTYEVLILLLYGIMIIFSFFTNLIALIVFSLGRRSRSELSPFLFNLSVFNIIMTVYCIPFTITSLIFQRWLYARELCIVLDVFKTFSVSGVLLTLITIAIDRYCAVKYPLTMKVYSVNKRNLIALLIIWILSIALAIVWSPARSLPMQQKRLWVNSRQLLKYYFEKVDNTTNLTEYDYLIKDFHFQLVDTIQCVPNKIKRPVEVRRTILNFLQTYFFPLFILAFVYLRIAAMLWHRSNDGQNDLSNTTTNHSFTHESIQFKKKLKQGIKMLVAVVVLYAILCHGTLLQLLYIASHFLTVSNTAINPIIYGFANNRFRSDIKQLRHRLLHCQERKSSLFRQKSDRRPSARPFEDQPRDSKLKQNLLPPNRRLTNPQQGSSSDQKSPRSIGSRSLTPKEPIDMTRYST